MDVIAIFAIIATIIFIGFFGEIIFKKTKIPDVLILIGVGIVIRTILEWVSPENLGDGTSLFTTFALVFILFQGAINIDIKVLVKSLQKTFSLTVTSLILTVAVCTAISYFIYHDIYISLLTGFILGGTSSAVVIPLVNNIEIRDKYGLVLSLESAISDVFCIIGAVTLIDIITTGIIDPADVFKSILSSFSLALIVGAVIGAIWTLILNKYDNALSKAYMVTIAILIGLYALVESPFIEASGAIAALAFGLVLGNSKTLFNFKNKKQPNNKHPRKKSIYYDNALNNVSLQQQTNDSHKSTTFQNVLTPSAKNFYSEISFFLKTFFFVYLGILIDFSNSQYFLYGALLTVGIYLIRPLAVTVIFRKQKLEIKERVLLETLIPKGLAAAVLAQLAVQSGVIPEGITQQFANVLLSVVLISILLTSILIFMTERNWFSGFYSVFRKKPKPTRKRKATTEI